MEQQQNQVRLSCRQWAAAFRQHVIQRSPPQQTQRQQQQQSMDEEMGFSALNNNNNNNKCRRHHHGMARPLIHVLYDRQCRGPRGVFQHATIWSLVAPVAMDDSLWQQEDGKNDEKEQESGRAANHFGRSEVEDKSKNREESGRKSPSTVFDTASLSPRGGGRGEVGGGTNANSLSQAAASAPDAPDLNLNSSRTEPQPQDGNDNDELEGSNEITTPQMAENDDKLTKALPSEKETDNSSDSCDSGNLIHRSPPACILVRDELLYFVEYVSSLNYHSAFFAHLGGDDATDEHGHLRPVSSRAVSTISIAFSGDGQTMASTHGDHSVKVSCCLTGRLLQSLEGHARTPWTVKYHPVRSDILASGCLGHQVRVWNWKQAVCLQMVRLEYAIISLTFHPSGQVLAIANGTRLHFWGVGNSIEASLPTDSVSRSSSAAPRNAPSSGTTLLLEMNQGHMLRCVHFPPDGRTLIIGGVNAPQQDDSRRRRPGGGASGATGVAAMSFYLRLWEFHLEPCLVKHHAPHSPPLLPISNPRILVPRALLYNDGGFDVSPDGKTLCACVEYWLPEGVDSAMELVAKEEYFYAQQLLESDNKRIKQQQANKEMAAAITASQEKNDVKGENQSIAQKPMPSAATTTPKKRKEPLNEPSSSDTSTSPPPDPNVTTTSLFLRDLSSPTPIFSDLPPAPQSPDPSALLSTPLNTNAQAPMRLSPPPPPGRRLIPNNSSGSSGTSTPSGSGGMPMHSPPPLPPGGNQFGSHTGNSFTSGTGSSAESRPPHPLSAMTITNHPDTRRGRFVPHVVTLSLDTTPLENSILARIDRYHANRNNPASTTPVPPVVYPALAVGYRPRLGQLLQACPLDAGKATAVTCVKFSPSCHFCLIGYGVREPVVDAGNNSGGTPRQHPVTAIYRIQGHAASKDNIDVDQSLSSSSSFMGQISTMLSRDDDVNIARFHPDPGHGFVYGTKQGRVRVVSTRPWMFYNETREDEEEDVVMQQG